eukprot:IDg6341t1
MGRSCPPYNELRHTSPTSSQSVETVSNRDARRAISCKYSLLPDSARDNASTEPGTRKKDIHTVAAALRTDGDKDDTGKNLESKPPDLKSAAATTEKEKENNHPHSS